MLYAHWRISAHPGRGRPRDGKGTRDNSFELSLLFKLVTCLVEGDLVPIEQSGAQGYHCM